MITKLIVINQPVKLMNPLTSEQQESVGEFHMYCAEFLAAVLDIYPENQQLRDYKNKFHLLCEANPFKPLDYFYEYVYCHRGYIETENIDFFVNIESNMSTNDENSILEALQLKTLWLRLTEEEQISNSETIFMYLKCLVFCTKVFRGI